MPFSPPNSSGTTGSILLIEEYEALAVAFGSALKRFQPSYTTHVVGSLSEAEAILGQTAPRLLIVDCDPPPRGTVSFFNQLRKATPEARALVVAAENSEELGEELPAVLQFIKKPFDLGKFGATIEALLGAGNTPPLGTVRDLSLVDFLLLHAITAATSILKVEAADARRGEIHFFSGRILHSEAGETSGVEALRAMLQWPSPEFGEAERPLDAPRTIHGEWPSLLRGLTRAAPVNRRARAKAVKPAAPPAVKRTKIVVVDDTDLLLTFLEEILRTAHPELEIVTASSGLEGMRRVAEVQPELVLLDYSLPDITGGVVCDRLLANEETAGIPIIMMSGHVPEMAKVAARSANVVGTIAKPFLSTALIELLERMLAALPELRAQVQKKRAVAAAMEPTPKKSRNGRRVSAARKAKKETPLLPPPPGNGEAHQSESLPPAGLAEETLPPSLADVPLPEEPAAVGTAEKEPVDPAPAAEKESPDELAPAENFAPPHFLPVAITAARSNFVVLGLALEVIALDLSPALRLTEIRARLFSPMVSLRVLPRALPGRPLSESRFHLARVDLDSGGNLERVRLQPGGGRLDRTQTRYGATIDGLALSPAANGGALRMTPTAVAPMRFELLALFELSRVELSADFLIDHLLLKNREEKMRATLVPEVGHLGATFKAAHVQLDASGLIAELRLVAV